MGMVPVHASVRLGQAHTTPEHMTSMPNQDSTAGLDSLVQIFGVAFLAQEGVAHSAVSTALTRSAAPSSGGAIRPPSAPRSRAGRGRSASA